MNNVRRKELAKVTAMIEEAQGILEGLRDEEEEYKDNMPENLRESDRYYAAEEACDNMESALDNLAEAIDAIDAATA